MDLPLDRAVDQTGLTVAFRAPLPGLRVVVERMWEPLVVDQGRPDVLVWIASNDSEFPLGLAVNARLRDHVEFAIWLRQPAAELSIELYQACAPQPPSDSPRTGIQPRIDHLAPQVPATGHRRHPRDATRAAR